MSDRDDADRSYHHLFGPVPSRRLGRSLGVDLVPFKTCPYDCVYCQLGPTTDKTPFRKRFVPAASVIHELELWLATGQPADTITLSGSGEPTLNSDIGEVTSWLRAHTPTPVAVITNGALLSHSDVRGAVCRAHRVVPSLDAATDLCFQRVNRPCDGVGVGDVIEGLRALRRDFAGSIWLEVMLVQGLNDCEDELCAIREVIDRTVPDRVQINTVARPPAEALARAVGSPGLRRAQSILGHRAEVVAPFDGDAPPGTDDAEIPVRIVEMLGRRPCTLGDIAGGLGIHRNWVSKHIPGLLRSGEISQQLRGGLTYYVTATREAVLSP